MALVAACGVMLSSQDFSTLFRSHREVRYLVTPANYVVSLSNVLLSSPPGPKKALLPVGLDARQTRAAAASRACCCWWSGKPRARRTGD